MTDKIPFAPEITRQKADFPPWFDGFLSCYVRPSRPSIAGALREFCRTLPAGAARPSEKQARHALAKLVVQHDRA